MKVLYTEKKLKKLGVEKLVEIATANTITPPAGATKPDIIAAILAAGCTFEPETANNGVTRFSKKEIIQSSWYSHKRDILSTELEDDEKYSHAEIAKILAEGQ